MDSASHLPAHSSPSTPEPEVSEAVNLPPLTAANPATQNTSPVNNQVQALLEQMQPLAPPEAIGIWPPALGWWVVLVLIITLVTAGAIASVNYLKQTAYRREALKKLAQFDPNLNDEQFAITLTTLLKQVALSAYPRKKNYILQLYGNKWLSFLNASARQEIFNAKDCFPLFSGLYQKNLNLEKRFLLGLARQWIKKHKALDSTTKKAAAQYPQAEVKHAAI